MGVFFKVWVYHSVDTALVYSSEGLEGLERIENVKIRRIGELVVSIMLP